MDTDIIEQWNGDVTVFRLRTARQKKRLVYKDFDKQLREIDKERRQLWKAQRNLGWEPLTPPVQRGWKRFFVLRDDVATGKHADFFDSILQKINTTDWSYRKDFLVKKRKYGRKTYVTKSQSLRRPCQYDWNKLGLTEREKQFFVEVWETDRNGRPVLRYEFSEPWRYVLRIKPNIIDKTRIRDTALEARIKSIDNYFERGGHNHRLTNLQGGYRRRHWRFVTKPRDINILKNKPLRQIVEEAKEESIHGN